MSVSLEKVVSDVKELFHRFVDNASVQSEEDVAKLREDIDTIGQDAEATAGDVLDAAKETVDESVTTASGVVAVPGNASETVDPTPALDTPKDQPAEADPLGGLDEAQIRELAIQQLSTGGNA